MGSPTQIGLQRRGDLAAALLLLALFVGCGDDSSRERPARSDRAPSMRAVERAGDGLIARRLPRVRYQGGPFLRHPRIVTVTFEGDDERLVARLERFGATITRTGWWRTVTEGYCAKGKSCIGKGRPGWRVRLDEPLPRALRDVEVGGLLARAARAGRLGRLDRETLLLVYLPRGVRLADAFVPRYCAGGPRALHRALRLGRMTIAYAVMPRCSGEAQLTATASQEIVEATTNPDPAARGFALDQDPATLGFSAAGVEPVDPCGLLTMDRHRTMAGGFVVQRAWSNRAASLGRDPCVPPSTRPYLALVPRQPAVRLVNEGDRATITLQARADRRVPRWAASALDLTGRQDHERYVEASLDRSTLAAGQTARLTITLHRRHPRQQSIVGIVSSLHGRSHLWPLTVVMR